MSVQIKNISQIKFNEIPFLESLKAINMEIFAEDLTLKWAERLKKFPNNLLTVAIDDQDIVGFKLGYQESDHFYSWLGGVLPSHRGQGLGSKLMETQHQWCRNNGFKVVRTKTLNRWRSMLLLNIKSGFDIVGLEKRDNGETKIVLEKLLLEE